MLNAAQQFYAAILPALAPKPRAPHGLWENGSFYPIPTGALAPQPEGYPRIANDKLGDKFLIFRGSSVKPSGYNLSNHCSRPAAKLRPQTVELLGPAACGKSNAPVFLTVIGQSHAADLAAYTTADMYADAVKEHGSQRKAAVALGISLGKLQRGLRK